MLPVRCPCNVTTAGVAPGGSVETLTCVPGGKQRAFSEARKKSAGAVVGRRPRGSRSGAGDAEGQSLARALSQLGQMQFCMEACLPVEL